MNIEFNSEDQFNIIRSIIEYLEYLAEHYAKTKGQYFLDRYNDVWKTYTKIGITTDDARDPKTRFGVNND